MRPIDIIKKTKKYRKWIRRENDFWGSHKIVTIKDVIWHYKEANRHFVLIEEEPWAWPPQWLWRHYKPMIEDIDNEDTVSSASI